MTHAPIYNLIYKNAFCKQTCQNVKFELHGLEISVLLRRSTVSLQIRLHFIKELMAWS